MINEVSGLSAVRGTMTFAWKGLRKFILGHKARALAPDYCHENRNQKTVSYQFFYVSKITC